MTDSHEPAPAAPARPSHDAHGQSIAAWSAVAVLLVGATILAVAVILLNIPMMIAGVVLLVAGPIVGTALARAGYGAGGAKDSFTNSAHHH